MSQPEGSAPKRGVQSIDMACALLRVFLDEEQPLMLRDIASRAGVTTAQAHGYLSSLRALGYVEQEGNAGRYRIAHRPVALARRGLATAPRARMVGAARNLSRRCGEMVVLDLWIDGSATVAFQTQDRQRLGIDLRAGLRNDPRNSASARVFAAFGLGEPGEMRDSCLNDIRENGYLLRDNLPVPGLASLAAPVIPPAGAEIEAVLSVIGTPGRLAELSGILVETARDASHEP